jgi:hypothetical protein
VRAPTEPHLRAISPLARPKTETGLRIPIPSQDSDSSAVFLLTVHPDHLLIEAVGIFTIQDMRAETARAAEVIRQQAGAGTSSPTSPTATSPSAA